MAKLRCKMSEMDRCCMGQWGGVSGDVWNFNPGEFRTAAIPDVDIQELQRGERIKLDLVLELIEQ